MLDELRMFVLTKFQFSDHFKLGLSCPGIGDLILRFDSKLTYYGIRTESLKFDRVCASI